MSDKSDINETDAEIDLELGLRLTRDLRDAAATMTNFEARYLVDLYYQMQKNRIAAKHQERIANKDAEPHAVVTWFAARAAWTEGQIKLALHSFAAARPLGQWCLSVYGIGPVISAGLIAHLGGRRRPTAGTIWRFAGLDPTVAWKRGHKRPWNARLKTLCWKAADCFKKFSGSEKCRYGRLYAERKAQEVANNEVGKYAAQAAAVLKSKPDHAQKAIYAEGKLPAGHLDMRALRWTAKLFLAHFHEMQMRLEFGEEPPLPYPIAHLDHAHKIEP